MTGTAKQVMKALIGGSANNFPTMPAMVKAGNKAVWQGSAKPGKTWVLTKNASNNFSLKI